MLKSDNATGNFTKVPQRIAVRIRIDPGQPLARAAAPGHVGAGAGRHGERAGDAVRRARRFLLAAARSPAASLPGTAPRPRRRPRRSSPPPAWRTALGRPARPIARRLVAGVRRSGADRAGRARARQQRRHRGRRRAGRGGARAEALARAQLLAADRRQRVPETQGQTLSPFGTPSRRDRRAARDHRQLRSRPVRPPAPRQPRRRARSCWRARRARDTVRLGDRGERRRAATSRCARSTSGWPSRARRSRRGPRRCGSRGGAPRPAIPRSLELSPGARREYRATEQLVPAAAAGDQPAGECAVACCSATRPGRSRAACRSTGCSPPPIPDGLPADLLRRRPDLVPGRTDAGRRRPHARQRSARRCCPTSR